VQYAYDRCWSFTASLRSSEEFVTGRELRVKGNFTNLKHHCNVNRGCQNWENSFVRWVIAVFLVLLAACGRRDDGGVKPHLDEAYPTKLSEWRLFTTRLEPNAGVAVYDVATPLFSDYSTKYRTVWMPAGEQAGYRADGVFEFPVGTVLSKTFSFPQKDGTERLIETRLLVRQRPGWIALVYVWNREQTEAVLETAPEPVPVRWVDEAGVERATTYEIPNVNQCTVCHERGEPLGPTGRNVRLEEWTSAGYLRGVPAVPVKPVVWNDAATGSLDQRAGAYLEVNCFSCHREGRKSKPLDVANGRAEMVRRMESLDLEKGMPNLGRTVVHAEGVALIRKWAKWAPASSQSPQR
jgi:hypothetical protein